MIVADPGACSPLDCASVGGTGESTHWDSRALGAASTQTLRADGTLRSHTESNWQHNAKSEASYTKQVQIAAGSSGLAQGTPVLIGVTLRLDGSVFTGSTVNYGANAGQAVVLTSDYRLLGSADVSAFWRVDDPTSTALICGEGPFCEQDQRVASFAFASRMLFDDSWSIQGTDSFDYSARARWSLSSNQAAAQSFGPPDESEFSATRAPLTSEQRLYDTGMLSFQYLTHVGAVNTISGSLSLFLQAMGMRTWANAAGDFGNTFDIELSDTQGLGLAILGESAGVTAFDGSVVIANPVPEPQTWALMAAGLAALGFVARRRRAGRR